MGKINRYFTREEVSCKCGCGFDVIDAETLNVITAVRERFDSPVYILSAARCSKHNAVIGGASRSKHLTGRAVDIRVKDVAPIEVYSYLDKVHSDRYGLGFYDSFTHLDTRPEKARW